MNDNVVAPLFDVLKAQFRMFGEGLQNMDSYVHQELAGIKTKLQVIDRKLEVNSIEDQQLKQMI